MHDRDDDLDVRIAGLLGRRVSLRHRIGPADAPGPRLTDSVGELADAATGPDGGPAVLVHTRRGTVRIRVDDVVALREVPAAAPRRASWSAVARLERLCADAWPAPVRRDLGEWWLRAGPGLPTRRTNSALAVGDPGLPVPDALARVRRFADEHGIAPVVSTPEGSPWWHAVRRQGWELSGDPGAESVVLVAGASALAGTGSPTATEFDPHPRPEWSALFGEHDDDPDAPARHAVLVPDALPVGFGLARRRVDGEVVGAVRAAVVADHVYVSRLEVVPSARRGGVATALTAGAARWALDRGARHVVLQVIRSNAAARALYARLGCVEHHRYHYLVPGRLTTPGVGHGA